MRAIAIEGFSGRDRLTLVDLPIPEPGPDDVLVRVRAARVGPWDAKTREGRFGRSCRATVRVKSRDFSKSTCRLQRTPSSRSTLGVIASLHVGWHCQINEKTIQNCQNT